MTCRSWPIRPNSESSTDADSWQPVARWVLILDQVGVSYGTHQVLRDVSLDVAEGDTVTILGPSGSGKSTLLAVLGGIQRPNQGNIAYRLDGQPVLPVRTAWISQTTNVLPRRTAIDNIALGGLSRGLPWLQALAEAHQHLENVGLSSAAERQARYLSGGEVQRLVIARALFAEAELLLADEPTGQLDLETTTEIVALLKTAATGRTLVVATHDPLAAEIGSRRYSIVNGGLVAHV